MDSALVTPSMHGVSRRGRTCVSVCVLGGLGSIQFPSLPSVSKSYTVFDPAGVHILF